MNDNKKPLIPAKLLTLNAYGAKQMQRISSKLFKSTIVRASLILACWGAMSGRALALIEGYGYNNNNIYKVDLITGAVTNAYTFPTALAGGAAIAQRPSDGMIFFLGGNVGNDPVYRWNPNTPNVAPVQVGTTGTTTGTAGSTTNAGYIPRLAFSPNGTLYAVNAPSTTLYTINQNTGQATGVNLTGTAAGGGDIAFAPDGRLYMILGAATAGTNNFYRVPLTGGAVTVLTSVTGTAASITGLAVDVNGKLVGSNSNTPGVLYEIPYAGGAATPRPASNPSTAFNDLASLVAPEFIITKTHTGNFTQGQTGVNYTLTVKNDGNLSSTGVTTTVTDTVPTGLTPTAATGTGWTCTLSGQTVTCTRTDALAPGASFPPITLTVNVASNAPTTITNIASVDNPGDPITTNNTASDATTINLAPDLTIAKTHSGNFTQAQTGATYTLTATNSGTAPTSGTVTVTDTVPTGLTPTAATGTGWTCNISGQTITCTRTDALAAGSSYPAIALRVNVAANAPTTVTNTANVSGGGEIVTNNNSGSDPTTIDPSADVSLSKTHTGNFTVGQNGTYTLTVTNNGLSSAAGPITITDTLPTGLTYVSSTGTGWTCSASGQVVTCTNSSSLASGANSSLTLTVAVGAGAATNVTNVATASSTTTDPNNANNTATDPTTVTPLADLSITKTDGQTSTTPGSPITYTITVTNNGATTVNSVNVTDNVPTSIQNPTFTASTGTYNSSTGAWTGLNLVSGQSITLTLRGTVATTATGTISNTATVTPPTNVSDPTTTNNNSTDTTSITPVADLSLTKTSSNPTPQLGETITYTVTLTNSGPSTATNVQVTDQVPAGLIFGLATPTLGTTYNNSTGIWSVPSLASGASVTLQITGTANSTGSITNTAEVTASQQFDPDSTPNNHITTEDDQASVTTPFQAADLSITKTDNQTTTTSGSAITYAIAVTNNGPSNVTGATITDTVPNIITGVSWTCVASTGSSCGTASGSGNTINTTANLLNGGTATYTVRGTLSATANGNVQNTAAVAVPTGITDPVNTNNSATDTTNVTTAPPQLRLVKRITAINSVNINGFIDNPSDSNDDNTVNWPTPRTDSLRGAINGGLVKPGDDVEYTIYFLSDGGNDATDVRVCDLVPTNTTFLTTAFNNSTPADGGLSGSDSGMALALGSTTPTAYLTNVSDAPDRGQFFAPGTSAPAACNSSSFTTPVPGSSNVSGAVVVDVVKSPTTLPKATAPGTPINSYGFVRFRVRVN